MSAIPKPKSGSWAKSILTIDDRIERSSNPKRRQLRSPPKPSPVQSLKTIRPGDPIQTHAIDSSDWNRDPMEQYLSTQEAQNLMLAWTGLSHRMDAIQKASEQMPTAFYDYEQPYIAAKTRADITDTDAERRAIHSISNYYNTLGVYRSDFDKNFNDLISRNAIYAMCEKAMMDYMGAVPWNIFDKNRKPVESAIEFMKYPNPQEDFGVILKMMIRDLMRYDAGAIVKSFSVGGKRGDGSHGRAAITLPKRHGQEHGEIKVVDTGYLLELKTYLGTEFWKEIDRVPMSINIPTAGNVPVQMTEPNSSHYTGWWSHGYTVRYWQRSRTGVYLPFQPEEICYFQMYPQSDQIYGTDFIKYLRYHLQYLIDSTKAAGQTFANGVIPNMIWKHPQIRTTAQLTERIMQMQAELKGPMKFGGAMHLVGDESIESMKFNLHDMEWLKGQEYVAKIVWAMWGFNPQEFTGGSENRATAYVGRNITKSRLLYPIMTLIENKINREILPYLQDYKKGWTFEFIKDIDQDDQQKIQHTKQIQWGSFSVARNAGVKPSLAARHIFGNEFTDAEYKEMDEQQEPMPGEPGQTDGENTPEGRYGAGSEGYQPVDFSDYGQGGEDTEQRMGESEEKEHKNVPMAKATEFPYTVITGEDDHFIKSQVYVKDRTQVPAGRSAYPGPRGGFYYNTKIRKPANRRSANIAGEGSNEQEQHGNPQPTPPDMPGGSIHYIQISGNGVALSAALYSYGTEVQAAKNEATKKFIEWVKPEMRGVKDEDQIDKLKELAKKEGLMVKEGGEPRS